MKNDDFDMPNIKTKVCDWEVWWDVLEEKNGYKLEQNAVFGNARIVKNKNRIAWGTLEAMEKKFKQLSKDKDWKKCKKGDILEVPRGFYSHFAVYIGKGKVIHYAAEDGDWGGEISIHEADFSEFIRDCTSFKILSFPNEYGEFDKRTIDFTTSACVISPNIDLDFKKFSKKMKYHLYSAEETVKRAKSKIGETEYSLIFNNCEHFAIWCKTGIHESRQVENVLKSCIAVSVVTMPI